jgi:alkaline phosphatase D
VVLWTRLAPAAAPRASETVGWELAADEAFRDVVRRGTETAVAADGHSVHAEAAGLEPSRWYWYRFTAGGARSEVGRTRTAPAAGREEALAFAIASCQRYDDGHYAAWRHLADEAPDLVVFLGDYIYESAPRANRVRTHVGSGPARTLDDYRARYAQYKSDANLRRAHAVAPWIVTWDDHEVQNDYASDRGEDLSHGFLARRAAGYQAWWEHMPLPSACGRATRACACSTATTGARSRASTCSTTASTATTTRARRPAAAARRRSNLADCPDLARPGRTLLGAEQERWLADGLAQRDARWNLVAQQTLVAPFTWTREGRHWTDGWAGYPGARDRFLDADRRAQGARHRRAVGRRPLQLPVRPQAARRRSARRGHRDRGLRHVDLELGARAGAHRRRAAAQPAHPLRARGRARVRRAQGGCRTHRRRAARRERRARPERDGAHGRAVRGRGRAGRASRQA